MNECNHRPYLCHLHHSRGTLSRIPAPAISRKPHSPHYASVAWWNERTHTHIVYPHHMAARWKRAFVTGRSSRQPPRSLVRAARSISLEVRLCRVAWQFV